VPTPQYRLFCQSLQAFSQGVIIEILGAFAWNYRIRLFAKVLHAPGSRAILLGKRTLKYMAAQRRIKVTESGKVTIVTFNDSKIIDEAEIQEFGQELYDLVEREGRKKIVLNFGNVEFLSSAALGKLIGFDRRVKQHGAELILSNIRPEIYEVFAITKLTKLFVIKDDEADALAAI
jgi:anti-anti-sigma factor